MSKYNKIKGLCLGIVLLFAGISARAQQAETSFYFDGFIPTAEFNNASGVKEGIFKPMDRHNVAMDAFAGMGFSLRFGLWCDIGYGQLQPFAEMSVLWNPTKGSVNDVYDNNELNVTMGSTPITPHYFNIPAALGLKYRYDITPIVKPFAEFSLGFDAMFITRNGYSQVPAMWYAYRPSLNFAWTVGAGTYLGDNVSVGLYYYGLGDHRIEYTGRTQNNVTDEFPSRVVKRNIGELAIRIGFHF